jgi:guanylate kinase
MKKSEKVIICGASGSGKDHLLRGLIKKKLKYQPKITTRPKRSLEKEGIDYNFIDNTIFNELLESNQIKAYQHFLINENDWYYAISNNNFDKNQVFIMTPHEISALSEEDRKKCFIVYLDIDESIRRKRITKRNDNNDSIDRRIESDKKDFENFREYDLKITDPEFDASMVYELMN